jgi:hypothetical protein
MIVVNSNKINKPFDFIATSFAANLSDTYNISIRQQPDGYYFCIKNTNNECIAIKYITSEHTTPSLLSNDTLLKLNYQSITYIGYGPFIIVPKSLITNNNYSTFLPIEKNLQLRAKNIVNPINEDTIIVSYTNQWTLPNKPTIIKHHEIEVLASMALNSPKQNSIWAEITSQHINIVVIHNHKLHLANTYPITSNNDAAYYILACYQQLNLSQEETELNIMGNTLYINPIPFLTDYIRHINTPKPLNWNAELPNQYTPLFSLQTNQI